MERLYVCSKEGSIAIYVKGSNLAIDIPVST